MATDEEIIESISRAFAGCERPAHFTNHTHCCECFEHDEVLLSRDLQTLKAEDVGNEGWDPIAFTSPQGFAYYFPALARLALSAPDARFGWYGPQLFRHLILDGPCNRRWEYFTPGQRGQVAELLIHIFDTRSELLESYNCADDLFRAIEIWSATNDAT
jgi:hypothetical protein